MFSLVVTVWVCVVASVVGWGLVLWLLQGVWFLFTRFRGVTLTGAIEYSWSVMVENSAKEPSVNVSGQVRMNYIGPSNNNVRT